MRSCALPHVPIRACAVDTPRGAFWCAMNDSEAFVVSAQGDVHSLALPNTAAKWRTVEPYAEGAVFLYGHPEERVCGGVRLRLAPRLEAQPFKLSFSGAAYALRSGALIVFRDGRAWIVQQDGEQWELPLPDGEVLRVAKPMQSGNLLGVFSYQSALIYTHDFGTPPCLVAHYPLRNADLKTAAGAFVVFSQRTYSAPATAHLWTGETPIALGTFKPPYEFLPLNTGGFIIYSPETWGDTTRYIAHHFSADGTRLKMFDLLSESAPYYAQAFGTDGVLFVKDESEYALYYAGNVSHWGGAAVQAAALGKHAVAITSDDGITAHLSVMTPATLRVLGRTALPRGAQLYGVPSGAAAFVVVKSALHILSATRLEMTDYVV